MSAPQNVSASERAQEDLDFFRLDTLVASNAERRHLGLPEIGQFVYAIEGLGDCYKSEILITDAFRQDLDVEAIQRLVSATGSSCIITCDEKVAHACLQRCHEYGNTDMSGCDMHRPDGSLLYVTWTNA